jgi:LuxR family maltose regulon positive regulatory protein
VQRPELMQFLDGAAARRLVIFKAPAGYGKTTLAAEWCQRLREGGALVAWLSLDIDDNEPGAFAYHLARAIEGAAPSLGRDAIDLLRASSLIPARNVISALLNGISETDADLYLFLDDYHVVGDRRCHELTALFLRYAPSNLHLVLVTRVEPRVALSRLRLDDQLAEIEASLLKFSPAETADFLGPDLAKRLGKSGIAKLHKATEGWPAALQLARISRANSTDAAAQVCAISGTTRTSSV